MVSRIEPRPSRLMHRLPKVLVHQIILKIFKKLNLKLLFLHFRFYISNQVSVKRPFSRNYLHLIKSSWIQWASSSACSRSRGSTEVDQCQLQSSPQFDPQLTLLIPVLLESLIWTSNGNMGNGNMVMVIW